MTATPAGHTVPTAAPAPDDLPSILDLPDPFAFDAGGRVRTVEDWTHRREELRTVLERDEYGPVPPKPTTVTGVELIRRSTKFDSAVTHRQFRITCELSPRPLTFLLDLHTPDESLPAPVIIRGDWCWRDVKDPILHEVLRRGYAIAEYNRCEIAPDNANRDTGIYPLLPGDYGAVAAWAWGFHRCIDFLTTLDVIDAQRIVVTGHSRGGKAALLAGATDERVALTAPNNSGCGGAGSFKHQAPGSEDVAAITRTFPFWFTPRFAEFAGRQDRLPFDQHFLKAMVAPRALLSTEGLGDRWANPEGTRLTHEAAREVYRFLGAADRIGVHFREGGHGHGLDDWQVLLDFADQVLNDRAPAAPRDFDANPFPNSPRRFAWSAPSR